MLELANRVKCERCGKEFEMTNPEYGCPYCNKSKRESVVKNQDKNSIASILKIIGWCLILIGFIAGIIVGNIGYVFNSLIMVTIWICFGISSLLFFSLGEIIQILHDIRWKLNN